MNNHQTPAAPTDERLKEIEARSDAATPGPWTVDEGEPEEGCPFRHVEGWTDTGEEWLCLSSEDAAFIAAVRTDVPDLVAEVRRLRAKVAEQANIIALQGQTVPQVQTVTVSTTDFGNLKPARCSHCGRTLVELPAGYMLMGGGTTGPNVADWTYHCSPICPPKQAPTATTNP